MQSGHPLLQRTASERRLPAEQITGLHQTRRTLGCLREPPPFGLRGVRRQPRARDVERWQVHRLPRQTPRGQSQVERSDLGTPRVDLQPEEIVPQHGADGLLDGEPLFGHPQSDQELERFHQKVAAAATRIEHPQGRGFTGPIGKGAGSGTPGAAALVPFVLGADTAHEAQVGEIVAAPGLQAYRPPKFLLVGRPPRQVRAIGQDPAGTPRTDGVVQEEQDHVVLGEQLRDRGQFVGTDLCARPVYFVLPLGLPELVGPAK